MTGNVKKRSSSILRRLTASQIWRAVAMNIRINIIVLLIAFVIMVSYVNYQASKTVALLTNYNGTLSNTVIAPVTDIIPDPATVTSLDEIIRTYIESIRPQLPSVDSSPFVGDEAIAILEQLMGFQFYTVDRLPYCFSYPHWISGILDFPEDTFGRLEFQWPGHFKYLVILPMDGDSQYAFLAFDMLPMAAVVFAGMGVLITFQFLMILFGSFDIRRTTKKILRPISELAATARIINSTPHSPVMEELKLDGAIKTLNAITEEHLDRRISIDDEREELKGLASAINSMLDRLDAAYQAQLRFVSDASHELRTPIAVIQGYANLLDRWGKRDEKALQESIDAIKLEAQGMEGLVEQLLFLARSDNNSLKLEMAETDVSVLLEEIVKETVMIDKNHKITGGIEKDLIVYGDPGLLKQAIRIFVDNALKYTPDDGRIRIKGIRQEGHIYLSVSDTGIGIGENDLPQVFERFFRADESRTRKTGGTGLGLAIAKYIIDRHGGYMEMVSRENIGTKITAVLPYRGTATSPPVVEVVERKADNYNKPKAV